MPTEIDLLGNWTSIGRIPVTENWQIFNGSIVNSEILRFNFYYNQSEWENLAGYRSFGLIRFYYPVGNHNVISASQRIYVKPQVEIREAPIAEHFRQKSILVRDIGVRLVKIARYLPASPNILNWDLEIDYLW